MMGFNDEAVIARAPGGPEVLELASIPTSEPGPGEVRIRHTAIGVNFIDTYYRSGLYRWPETPLVVGGEAAGTIDAVGAGVEGLKQGDRVAYTTPLGAYRRRRLIAADRVVRVPEGISDEVAASIMLKGLTAQYLVTSSFRVEPGHVVLVHAAAGGVGLILGQWLAAIGATAIGTAGGADKVALARAHGYAHVIDYRTGDFVAAVAEITGGRGCDVVYDSVGKDTWRGSLQCLRRFGMFVSFGQSSGMIEDFRLADLAAGGSLSANRPVLFDYIADRTALEARAAAMFAMLSAGKIRAEPHHRLALHDAAEAHRALEARRTTGATVLLP